MLTQPLEFVEGWESLENNQTGDVALLSDSLNLV
jgi:hypothetical protein